MSWFISAIILSLSIWLNRFLGERGLSHPELVAAIAGIISECRRVLAPGGRLAGITTALDRTAAGYTAFDRLFQVIPTTAGVPLHGTAALASFTITVPANPGTGSVAGFYGADVSTAGLMVAPGDVLELSGTAYRFDLGW